ncbi:MAG: MFS transporter [Chloroflexi bacterium]|nr:MFS transporter [Chloroflexota bacterium]
MRLPDYRLYWSGQLTSQTGTWMQSTAQAWLVLKLTDSPLALGTVAMVQFTPVLLFSLIGGVLADRLPKRRLLMLTQTVMLLQAATLAALTWTGRVQLWQIYVLAAILGTANAIDNPTRQAFVRELVGQDDLPNAIALNSMQLNLSRIMGPSLSGLLIVVVGVAGCFAVNAVSSLAVLAALWRVRARGAPVGTGRARSNMLGQIGEGLRYAARAPEAALVLLVVAVIGTFGYNFTTVLPLVAEYVLGADPLQFGTLTSALGAGSLLAALGMAASGRATRRGMFAGAAGFSLMLAVVGLSPWWVLTLPALVGLGACSIIFSTTANTRLQLATPEALRGRVMSLYFLLFAGSTPIGGLTIGLLAQRVGVPETVALAAIACGLGVAGGLVYAYRHRAALGPDGPRPATAPAVPKPEPPVSDGRRAETRIGD